MITGRNVLATAVLISVFSLISITWTLNSDSDFELGRNSLGVRSQGQRGFYETLEALNVSVRRSSDPPSNSPSNLLKFSSTLVFLEPDARMIEIEPAYITKVAEWVEAGGCVLYAPATSRSLLSKHQKIKPDKKRPKTFSELIGIGKTSLSRWRVESSDGRGPAELVPATSTKARQPVRDDVHSLFSPAPTATVSLAVECQGEWKSLASSISKVSVPQESVRLCKDFGDRPVARIIVPRSEGEPLTLAAMFRHGKGRVIVVSDPTLAHNGFLANDDNAVALVNLVADQDLVDAQGEVVFDEFYHGLIPRGNPLVLLRRPLFTILMAMICMAIGVYAWRHGVRLGPAVEARQTSRRSLQEYVAAMSRLFSESHGRARFLLEENRQGLVWTLQSELGMTGSKNVEENIVRVLKRRQPERAQRVVNCLKEFDRTLRQDTISDRDAINTIRRVPDCL